MSVAVNELVWNIFTIIHKEFDHTNFKWGSTRNILHGFIINFDSNIGVGDDGLSDHGLQILVEFMSCVEVVWVNLRVVINTFLLVEQLVSGHIKCAFCQCSGFTDANVVKHGTNLYTLQILDEDVILLHFVG